MAKASCDSFAADLRYMWVYWAVATSDEATEDVL